MSSPQVTQQTSGPGTACLTWSQEFCFVDRNSCSCQAVPILALQAGYYNFFQTEL